jgi:YVTN family beta-propeller protein
LVRIALALLSIAACTTSRSMDSARSSDASTTAAPVPKNAEPAIASATPPPRAHPPALPSLEVQEVESTGLQPKGAMLSHDGKTLFVTNFLELNGKKIVTMYDAATLEPKGQLDLFAVVVESALSPDDKTLYLSSFWGHSVLFVDLATKTIVREVKAGAHPKVLTLTPDGKTLFAANWSGDTVTEIDVAEGVVVRTLKTGKSPRGMAVTSKGTLYVANFYGESIEVYEGADRSAQHRLPMCKCPRHLALSPDEKTLYVSCLNKSRIDAVDLATETVVHKAHVGDSPKSIAVSADGRYIWSADYGLTRSVSVVDTKDWSAKVFPVPGMDRGSGIAVAPDGEHAYVTGWYDAHVYKVGFEGTGGRPAEAKAKIAKWLYRPFSKDPGDGQ